MTWTDLDLSTAHFWNDRNGNPWGRYENGKLIANSGSWIDFSFLGLVLDGATFYEFEVTFDQGANANAITIWAIGGYTQDHYATDWGDIEYTKTVNNNALRVAMGPNGRTDWEYSVERWGAILPVFETLSGVTSVRYRVVDGPPAGRVISYVLDNGTTAPAGGTTPATAATISTNQISAPVGPDVHEAWYKFTATQTTKVHFDTELSYNFTDGLPYGPAMEFLDSNLAHIDYGSQAYDVVAGQTYYVNLSSSMQLVMFLRVSDYGRITDWTSPGDQYLVLAGGGEHHPAAYPQPNRYWGNGYGTSQAVYGITQTLGASGGYQIRQAFGGPYASDDAGGPECVWRWGRRMLGGMQYWSATGGGEYSAPGTCANYPATTQSNINANNDNVSIYYSADTGSFMIPQFTSAGANVRALYASVTGIEAAYGVAPTPDDYPVEFSAASLEWESEDKARLIDLEVAPDEPISAAGDPGQTRWAVFVTPDNSTGVENPPGYFGPSREAAGTGTIFRSNGDGPEGLEGRANTVLTTYSGGEYPFASLGPTLIEAARNMEKNDSLWFGSGGRSALCFVGYHPAILTDTLPGQLSPYGPAPQSHSDYRGGQTVSMRARLQPVRHRWVESPAAPFASVFDPLLDANLDGDVGEVIQHFEG